MKPTSALTSIFFASVCMVVQAAVLTAQTPRLTVTSSDAQLRVETLSLSNPVDPVILGKDDVLRVTFQVVDKVTGAAIQPHQTFLRFYDETTGEEGIQPVRTTAGGKAKFELNMAKPPASLPPSTDAAPLRVTLLLGSSGHIPLSAHLFDLFVPASLPPSVHPEEDLFHPLPEIHHTFRPQQKQPSKLLSFVFSILVLAPWFALLGLWTHLWPGLALLYSPSVLLFVLMLGAFESLLVWYWVDLRLGEVLSYGAFLGSLAFLVGKRALSKVGDHRLNHT